MKPTVSMVLGSVKFVILFAKKKKGLRTIVVTDRLIERQERLVMMGTQNLMMVVMTPVIKNIVGME